jgi:NifU-like protein involved in Fe-S cluster formation
VLGKTIDELKEIERQALLMLKQKGAHENLNELEADTGMPD